MDKKKKRELVKKLKAEAFAKEVEAMPISKEDLGDLFDWLDRPEAFECDHSLKQTLEFLNNRDLDHSIIIPWLNEYGGYCDCEVLFNVEDKWEDFISQ